MSTTNHSAKRAERLVRILALVHDRGFILLSELVAELGASPATIRRDVALLDDRGLIDRTHGGAKARDNTDEIPVILRNGEHKAAKAAIARLAVQQLPQGRHTVALTGGTTTTEVVRCLDERKDLTIVTNSVLLGLEAATQGHARVLIAGGVLRRSSLELIGGLTEAVLKQTSLGTAFIGCDGISAEGGATTHHEVEARTNHTMVTHSTRVIIVADGSKVGKVTSAQLATMSEIDMLVTDESADADALEAIRKAGPTVLTATVIDDPDDRGPCI